MTTSSRPTGRDDVVEAILTSAQDLFGERSPGAVSLREIAERANVNVGLVHQYIGSKDRVVAEALRRTAASTAERLGESDTLLSALQVIATSGNGTIARMTAWSLLEGADPAELMRESPSLAVLANLARADSDLGTGSVDDDDARILAAVAMVLALGSRMFGATALAAAGLEDDSRVRYEETVGRLMQALARHADELLGYDDRTTNTATDQ